MLPKYTKLSTCSTALPSTVMLGGCGPEPMFWILVFAQETRRPSVDDEQLKLDKQLAAFDDVFVWAAYICQCDLRHSLLGLDHLGFMKQCIVRLESRKTDGW